VRRELSPDLLAATRNHKHELTSLAASNDDKPAEADLAERAAMAIRARLAKRPAA
jgi:hypothetical protein